MFATAMTLMGLLSLGQAPDGAIAQALGSTVLDGLAFESDIQWHRGDYARAGLARLVAAELDPEDAVAYIDSAWLAWSWGYTDLGRQVCRRALEMNPRSPDAAYEIAALVRLWGDGDWSLELLRRAHRGDPADRVTALALGAALRERELWSEAAQVYRTLAMHHEGDPSAARFLERYEAWGHMRPTMDGAEAP
jgi:Flp pilus assembly protein TadD